MLYSNIKSVFAVYQCFLSFFFFCVVFLLTHVIFPSPSYKSSFPVLPAFSFTKPYHTLHGSRNWNDRCYFSSFSNLTSPFGNYSCPVLLLFMWHFRPLLTTSILTEPYTVWLFEASQTQNISGELFWSNTFPFRTSSSGLSFYSVHSFHHQKPVL